jgi:hypothetical protein
MYSFLLACKLSQCTASKSEWFGGFCYFQNMANRAEEMANRVEETVNINFCVVMRQDIVMNLGHGQASLHEGNGIEHLHFSLWILQTTTDHHNYINQFLQTNKPSLQNGVNNLHNLQILSTDIDQILHQQKFSVNVWVTALSDPSFQTTSMHIIMHCFYMLHLRA